MERPAVDIKGQTAVLGSDQLDCLEIPQVWLPTVQEVLQADWQDVWQEPHSGVSNGFLRLPATIVLMCPLFFIFFLQQHDNLPNTTTLLILNLQQHKRKSFRTCRLFRISPVSHFLFHASVMVSIDQSVKLFGKPQQPLAVQGLNPSPDLHFLPELLDPLQKIALIHPGTPHPC
jgi:hypothetical protein